MTFDPSAFSNIILILTAWGGAFVAALWLSLVIWTYAISRARPRSAGAHTGVLVVAVLFLPGIVIYLILRPSRTLDDEYQQSLEERPCSTRSKCLSVPGLRQAHQRQLDGLPGLSHQAEEILHSAAS